MHFRYLSISHHTAPVSRRERFHLDEAEKERLTDAFRKAFTDLNSLLILVTCNRTELYFETEYTRAVQVRDFFLNWKLGKVTSEDQVDFRISDQTDDTVRHLLSVAAGLKSSVLGDAEIIYQIKKAYH
jgi:glutamyl-tRNA reductase